MLGQTNGVWSLVVLPQWVPEPGVCRGMALLRDLADKLLCDTDCNESLDTMLGFSLSLDRLILLVYIQQAIVCLFLLSGCICFSWL